MFSLLYNLCCRVLFKSFLWADSYIEYTMLVLFSSSSGEIRDSVGGARLAETLNMWFSIYHALLAD